MESDFNLVTVCTVKSATEAELIRSALEAVGIACQIGNESQAGFAGVFEIDLLTHANNLEAAQKYLRKLRRQKLERKKKRAEAQGQGRADVRGDPGKTAAHEADQGLSFRCKNKLVFV